MGRNYDVVTFTSKYLFLRRPRVAIFVDIIKIVAMFVKTIRKDSKTLKELETMYQNTICICIF